MASSGRTRRYSLLASVVALCGTAILLTAALKPGITLSNRLTPARDARVIRSAMTPRAGWQPPYRWRINVGDTVRWTGVGMPDTLIDTVRGIYAPCAVYRVTVRPVNARDSLTVKTDLCRGPTHTELAIADSYPDAGVWLAVCGARGDTVMAGRAMPVALMGKNRYTGKTRVLAGKLGACATSTASGSP